MVLLLAAFFAEFYFKNQLNFFQRVLEEGFPKQQFQFKITIEFYYIFVFYLYFVLPSEET
jgi:hypothetical protein